jgi:predicted PurR-regulated permease PerM
MQDTLTRSLLRIGMVVGAAILVFDGGYVAPITQQLSEYTYEYVASVGASMSASVEPNEINTLSAELAEAQRQLMAREQALEEREIAARTFGSGADTDYSTYIISLLLFIIIVLLMLNYVMDWQRARMLYRNEEVRA